MLIILTTHPIQYQVPIWQELARRGRVPFEVWYMSDHGTRESLDRDFGRTFAWDLKTLDGYPYRFLRAAKRSVPSSFWRCRIAENLCKELRSAGARALWIHGWQVAGYWQAVRAANRGGIPVWLRAESNDLKPIPTWKRLPKRTLLSWLFRNVHEFLYIGSANRRLYESYGVPAEKLHFAPYAVDNQRFARQAEVLRPQRLELRRGWGITDDAYCILFCGKFVSKKRPFDLIGASEALRSKVPGIKPHLLFVGSGMLGAQLRAACSVVYDREAQCASSSRIGSTINSVHSSFVGFLNQTEISRAYVASECLVLPSDSGETWGLVVNEAMASGLPVAASSSCGCTEDLVAAIDPQRVFSCGVADAIASAILACRAKQDAVIPASLVLDAHSVETNVRAVENLYTKSMRTTSLL